jgi:hypothetical protein
MLASLRGQQFNEQGAMANLAGNQRGAMLREQEGLQQSPLNDLRSLMGANPNNPAFQGFSQAGMGQGVDFSGAGNQQFKAAMDAYNAQQAKSGSMMSGLFGLGGAMLGGPIGGALGTKLGSMMG